MSDEQKTIEPEHTPVAGDSEQANAPRSALPKFRLTHGPDVDEIEAADAVEAVALFNDKRSKWPNPSEVSVERV